MNYDIEKINTILSDFYHATGINMDLRREDFSFINNQSFWENRRYCKMIQQTERGRAACLHSDECLFRKSRESKGLAMLCCHGGLTDIAEPILYGEEILGYVIFGQLRSEGNFEKIRDYIASLGLSAAEMEEYYHQIPYYSSEQIKSIAHIAKILLKHILLENILQPHFDENIQRAIGYIDENLEQPLSVSEICKNANLSKSALYRGFQRALQSTVWEYIHQKRIERAAVLLRKTDLSIEELAQRLGYTGGSYFSKLFKKRMGCSPLQYKKRLKAQEK